MNTEDKLVRISLRQGEAYATGYYTKTLVNKLIEVKKENPERYANKDLDAMEEAKSRLKKEGVEYRTEEQMLEDRVQEKIQEMLSRMTEEEKEQLQKTLREQGI